MTLQELPLSQLLQRREIFAIFDNEFQQSIWLDTTALLKYEGSVNDLYKDKTVPTEILDRIVEKLQSMEE